MGDPYLEFMLLLLLFLPYLPPIPRFAVTAFWGGLQFSRLSFQLSIHSPFHPPSHNSHLALKL